MTSFQGESLGSCLNMTSGQLLLLYVDSTKVEAKRQIERIYSIKMGHPHVDSSDFIETLHKQAYPPNPKKDKEIGLEGFKTAMKKFGAVVKEDKGLLLTEGEEDGTKRKETTS